MKANIIIMVGRRGFEHVEAGVQGRMRKDARGENADRYCWAFSEAAWPVKSKDHLPPGISAII